MYTITKRNAQNSYDRMHRFYWMIYGFMAGFTSVYLLERGFTNAQIGLVLGGGYLLSTILQPLIAAFVEKTGVKLRLAVVGLYAMLVVVGLMILFLPLSQALLAVGLMICLGLESAIAPSISAMIQVYEAAGMPVNFGRGRGWGSLTYALTAAVMGRILVVISPLYLPVFYVVVSLGMCVYLLMIRMPGEAPIQKSAGADETVSAMTLIQKPWFLFLMIGTAFLALNALMTGSYMIQIMTDIGGGSAEQGIAVAIAAGMEFPAMILYSRVAKKIGDRRMMVICGWVWAIKCGLIAIAPTPTFIFAAQFLQFAGYGFFVPANVKYFQELLPDKAFLKAQSLSGSAFTAGTLVAVVGGGVLLDALGVRGTLYIGECFSLVGAVMISLSVWFARKS